MPADSGFRTVTWRDGALTMIDQRLLPQEERWLRLTGVDEAASAIRDMAVRGAPAIGVAAAYAMVLALAEGAPAGAPPADHAAALARLNAAADLLRAARPTAVNLGWAVERQLAVAREWEAGGAAGAERVCRTDVTDRTGRTDRSDGADGCSAAAMSHRSSQSHASSESYPPSTLTAALLAEAHAIAEEDRAACRAMGRLGAALLPDPCRVVHHCNTGALATVDYGTALGVVRAAHEDGKRIEVLVDETRPRLQGARLTAWELGRLGVPHRLIADGAAAHFMAQGGIDAVLVGADRIAANGDTANKIGTYALAIAARHHGIPFYVVAPLSTVDPAAPDGRAIPIEERAAEELTMVEGRPIAPAGTPVGNPAFDVTPATLISAIVTEAAVVHPPFGPGLARLLAAPVSALSD